MERVDAQAIYLKQMELGPMQNFVYLVGDPETRECVVVDPAWEIDTIVGTAEADGMTITDALVTHTHQDHVGGSLESCGMPARTPTTRPCFPVTTTAAPPPRSARRGARTPSCASPRSAISYKRWAAGVSGSRSAGHAPSPPSTPSTWPVM